MKTHGECKCGFVGELEDKECPQCRAIPYKELCEEYRKVELRNPIPPAENLGTMYTGKCLCCQESRFDLIYGACHRCRGILGERCGKVARQIRSNPEFAERIIGHLHGKHKEAFISIFGIPNTMWQA